MFIKMVTLRIILVTLVAVVYASAAPAKVYQNEVARNGKFFPIFNNSPEGYTDPATGQFMITPMPASGKLAKNFKNFPLSWSFLMAPIPGLSGSVISKDNLVPLLESKHGDDRLGYYLINPFGNAVTMTNVFGRNFQDADKDHILEQNGVFFSSDDLDTDSKVINALLETERQDQKPTIYNGLSQQNLGAFNPFTQGLTQQRIQQLGFYPSRINTRYPASFFDQTQLNQNLAQFSTYPNIVRSPSYIPPIHAFGYPSIPAVNGMNYLSRPSWASRSLKYNLETIEEDDETKKSYS